MKKWFKRLLAFFVILLTILAIFAIFAYVNYGDYFLAPKKRLGLNEFYPEMPPDERHVYIELPIDHNNPRSGKYKGFYMLSPGFVPGGNVVIFLTDGQQNKVHPSVNFDYQFDKLKGLSFVIIGRRGHYPSLFPEVYKDGSLDHRKALDLYGTWQQVEDIELVRRDLQRKGRLGSDGKIMLFGGSGAGILLQQYIAKYPDRVSRALMEATGAPDIAKENGINFGCNFNDQMSSNPETISQLNKIFETGNIDRQSLCYILFKLPYFNIDGKDLRIKLIKEISSGDPSSYKKYWQQPDMNYIFTKIFMSLPMMEATRVRLLEIVGEHIVKYPDGKLNLMFEWEKVILKDYLEKISEGAISVPVINLIKDRPKFTGEVLVLSGTEDQVFQPKLGELLSGAYQKSKFALFKDTHAFIMNEDYYRELRKTFFTGGLYSENLNKLLSDPRNLYNKNR